MPHGIVWILDIAEHPGACGTGMDTCRFEAPGCTVITPGAFLGRMGNGTDEPAGVWTCLDAVTAPNATRTIHKYQSVYRLVTGADRTYLNTGRIGAVVAQLGNKEGTKHVNLAFELV